MTLSDQSSVTGGGLDPYNALFVNMDNMGTERFGNYDCLVHSCADNAIFVKFEMSNRKISKEDSQFYILNPLRNLANLMNFSVLKTLIPLANFRAS